MNRFVTMLLVAVGVAGVGVVGGPSLTPATGKTGLIELVLCADADTRQVVWMDANGRRVDPEDTCGEVHCPACTTAPDEVLPAATLFPEPMRVDRDQSFTVNSVLHGPVRWRAPMSHGPPFARVS